MRMGILYSWEFLRITFFEVDYFRSYYVYIFKDNIDNPYGM